MDEETLVIIEDSNVEKIINDVIIYEKKIKDDSVLILNKEQIINELTNLLVNKYKQLSKTQKKVDLYMNLFDSADLKHDIITINTLKPIFFCKKIVIQHGDKNDLYGEIDQDFQDMFSLQAQPFDTFIGQFKSLNTDKANSYLHSANALYSLTKPFLNTNKNNYTHERITQENTVDAFRHFIFKEYDKNELSKANINKFETFRLLDSISIETGKRPEVPDIKPGCTSGLHYLSSVNEQIVYEGDKIDIVGYVNLGPSEELGIINNFDINEYFQHIIKLIPNTKVKILFNDFVFDKKGNVIYQLEGTVIQNNESYVIIKPQKIITINGINLATIKIDINKPNYCFVYTIKYTDYMFHKPLLKKDTIIFTLLNGNEPLLNTLNIIKPISISELFFMNIDLFPTITNIYELRKLLNNVLHIDFDKITLKMHNILTKLINYNPNLPIPNKLYNPTFYIPLYSNSIDILDFTKYQEFLQNYSQIYNGSKTFIDSTLNRYAYLIDKNDYGYIYILQIIKEKINQKYKLISVNTEIFKKHLSTLKKEIDIISKEITQIKQTSSVIKPIIAKRYNNYIDIENDNNISLYFDKEFDPTKYSLINLINKNLSENEQKYAIIEKLNLDKTFHGLSQKNLEFEAKSIINGKRKIQYGEHAILYLENGHSVIYIRRNIAGTSLWIKVLKTPFPLCTENIKSFEDIQNAEAIILDPFDMLCKKQKDIRLNINYNNKLQKIYTIESILAFINNFDIINTNIDADIEHYKLQFQLIKNDTLFSLENLRRHFKITIDENSNIDNLYQDYTGDSELLDLDKIFNNVDFSESSPFQIFFTKKEIIELEENEDIIQTFINLNDITLSESIHKYILLQMNTTYPKKDIFDKIIKEENTLKKQINKELYETKTNYKLKIDMLIKNKLKIFETNILKKYYFDIIIFTAGLLILVMMAEYPNIVIKKIMPKCVKYFSYIGHPIASDNAVQSLTKYFACIISSIGVPGDLRFDQFTSMNLQDIDTHIKKIIDDIQQINPEIIKKIENNKKSLIQIKHKNITDYGKYMKLAHSYKPNFEFKSEIDPINKDDANIINYLKEINNNIKKTKILKNTIYNNPLLINSCCIEKLTHVTNFYNFFNTNINYNLAKDKINNLPNIFPITNSYIPSSKVILGIQNLFGNKKITISKTIDINYQEKNKFNNSFYEGLKSFTTKNNIIANDNIFIDLPNKYEDIDWWGDIFYPTLEKDFDYISECIRNYYDKVNLDTLMQVKIIISGKSFLKSSNLRSSLFSFIKFKLTSFLSQIINKKKIIDETGENSFVKLLDSLQSNSLYDEVLKKINIVFLQSLKNIEDLFFNSKNDETLVIQNISILAYLFIKILISILYVTVNDDFNISKLKSTTLQLLKINQKKLLSLSSSIVFYFIEELNKFIILNDTDNDKIKKKIEELREKRKQAMISAYSSDDEARKLQILLKKMGLKIDDSDDLNKDDIKEKIPLTQTQIQNIQEYENVQQDNANYNIGEYQGDNADGDEIEEYYFANSEAEFL